MPLFCTPLNFAKFLFSEIHPVKKNKALATPTLSDSPALRKAYGQKWDNCASKDNINPSCGKQKAPTPRPPPWGRERPSGVNIAARRPARRGGKPFGRACGPPWRPCRPPPTWGPWAPSPPRRTRCARGAAHRCATSRGFPLLTAPPNYGKLIVARRGGHHCPHYRKRAAIRESGALLFSLPLLPGSYVQEGAPCAGGAPRPRNPLPPSLFGGWARKVKQLYRAPVSATGPQRGPAASRTERALRAPSVRPPGAARPNAPAGPCGAAVRALAPPVKKARPSPAGASRPCLFSGAAAPGSFPA